MAVTTAHAPKIEPMEPFYAVCVSLIALLAGCSLLVPAMVWAFRRSSDSIRSLEEGREYFRRDP